jgi:hypothetical protein
MYVKVLLGEAPWHSAAVIAMHHHPPGVRRNDPAATSHADGNAVTLKDETKICLAAGKPGQRVRQPDPVRIGTRGGLSVEMEIDPEPVASRRIRDRVEAAISDLTQCVSQTREMSGATSSLVQVISSFSEGGIENQTVLWPETA